ncbi:GCN5 family acetyltransferase [Mycolicibacterium conceptionense]|uniref:GNAT family N-acetyltransferase n=1 Tax=Mycobacteriaceae TaxID=1762 RepID=UPI00096FDA82|nr:MULTISPECIES: GNAT family protein [Mycobacteriaceae]OMB89924.1 GCN5 family acetyltransferase [Mycolicibacterium conceptionense]SKK24766.1 Putative acetyltransferase [Mycobacteroides abscessus subsp. massiliense]
MIASVHALAEDHLSEIIAACGDWAELAQYGPPYWRPRSTAELRRKIAATAGPQPGTEYTFVLVAQDGELVGECSLHGIDYRNRLAQIGVCIWNPNDRGRGYGQLGVQHVIDWGTGYLGLLRVEAWIVDGNEPSLKLFRRCGFTHEATLRSRYLHAGERRAMHVLALDTLA